MKRGDHISILPSQTLHDMMLSDLFGREGEIADIVFADKKGVIGCWVKLDELYQNESEWFIPLSSIAVTENKPV